MKQSAPVPRGFAGIPRKQTQSTMQGRPSVRSYLSQPSPTSLPGRRALPGAGRHILAGASPRMGDEEPQRTARSTGGDTASSVSVAAAAAAAEDVDDAGDGGGASVLELAKGGEVLLTHLAELGNANGQLLNQLQAHAREVQLLEESGRQQQGLIREFERRAERERRSEAVRTADALERSEAAAARAEAVEREALNREEALRLELAELRSELDSFRESSNKEKEGLREQLREAELGREEAQAQIQELERRLGRAAEDASSAPSREQGLEMECNLLRSRFAKQLAGCEAAERALTESRAQQNHLKAGLERSTGEVHHLRQKLAEAQDAAAFRQEVCNDLKRQLRVQRDEADKQLSRERTKMEHIARLEGVLPKQILTKAFG